MHLTSYVLYIHFLTCFKEFTPNIPLNVLASRWCNKYYIYTADC